MSRRNCIEHSMKEKALNLFRNNQLAEAREIYAEICMSHRRDTDAWVMLGVINVRLGHCKEAAECGQHVLSVEPVNAGAFYVMGVSMHCQGNADKAIRYLRKAIQCQPKLFDAHYTLAVVLDESGKSDDAIDCYLKAIELNPGFVEALCNVGVLFMSLGRRHDAIDVFQRALSLKPDNVQVLCNLGVLFLINGSEESAFKYVKTAIRIEPEFFDARYIMGDILRHQGKYDAALDSYKKALMINPGDESVISAVSGILEKRGEYGQAYKLISPLIKGGTLNPGALLVYSKIAGYTGEGEQAIFALDECLSKGGLSPNMRIDMNYELGRSYDNIGQYDKAFSCYREANEETKRLSFDIVREYKPNEKEQAEVNALLECNRDFWSELPHATIETERPIFIIGMPRSGTSLAEQILSSHPDVYGAGELSTLGKISHSLSPVTKSAPAYHKSLASLSAGVIDKMALNYLSELEERADDLMRVVDKNPYNFLHVGLISLLFPRCRLIHMTRNPLDNCLSIYFQKFNINITYACDLYQIGEYYRRYKLLMDHWGKVLDVPVLEVSYEELVNDKDRVIRDMVHFCDLEWDTRCLEFFKTKRDINTPSYHQVRQPLYNKSVGRWKNYRKYITQLEEIFQH